MPVGDHFQLMLADASGNAAVYEFANCAGKPLRAVRRPENGVVCAYNHYQSAEITAVYPEKATLFVRAATGDRGADGARGQGRAE